MDITYREVFLSAYIGRWRIQHTTTSSQQTWPSTTCSSVTDAHCNFQFSFDSPPGVKLPLIQWTKRANSIVTPYNFSNILTSIIVNYRKRFSVVLFKLPENADNLSNRELPNASVRLRRKYETCRISSFCLLASSYRSYVFVPCFCSVFIRVFVWGLRLRWFVHPKAYEVANRWPTIRTNDVYSGVYSAGLPNHWLLVTGV